jgi:hypothetical protein
LPGGRGRRRWRPGRPGGPGRCRARRSRGTPTASTATSAPSPPLRLMTTSAGFSASLLTVTSAPNADVAVQHADLEPGREDVGQEQHLLVAEPLGNLVEAVVGEGDAGQLGLGAVDQVPENPAAAALALPVHPLAAVLAAPAGRDAGDQHAVALAHVLDGVAGLDHRPDGLMAEGPPLGAGRHVTLEDVQVGAADGGRVDLDDRVAGLLQLGVRLGGKRAAFAGATG